MSRIGARASRIAALLAMACVLSVAWGAGWSIQTVALRDFRDAQATVADLRAFGLDAYSEFTMNAGVQYVRVRVGCFATRESAEELARRLSDYLVAAAVPVERTADAPSAGCLEERTGFLKPATWRQVAEGIPAFEVTMADTTAVVRHTGRNWRIVQGTAELSPFEAPVSPRFRQGSVLDVPVVEMSIGGAWLVVCPGQLMAEVGDVAIVDRGDRIVSCRLRPPTTLAEGT